MQKLLLMFAVLAGSVFAQNAPLACEGRRATVRISEITPNGTAKGFMAAVAAHQAWYRSHGFMEDKIITLPVIVRDEKTQARSYSEKQFWSMHIFGPAGADPKRDEAYDAFVKLYRDNSDIKSSYDVCLPTDSLR
jgi:hypothetical protein